MSEILGTMFAKVVALMSLGVVLAGLYQVLAVNKSADAIAQVGTFTGNVEGIYGGQNDYTSLTQAVALKLAPDTMVKSGALINPYGGAVTVNVNASNVAAYDVNSASFPSKGCAQMIKGFTSLVGVKVNGAVLALPIDAGAAALACGNASNDLVLTFSH